MRHGASYIARKSAGAYSHIPPRRRKWLWIALGVAVAAVAVYFVTRPKPAPPAPPVVEVEPVTTENVNIYGEYVGRVRAQQFVEIRARVEGYLERMLFEEGTYINKGQTLFVIDQIGRASCRERV